MTKTLQDAADEAIQRGLDVDHLHRVETVAKRFEVSRAQIYVLIRNGQLRSLKVGGARRIPESAIRDFIAAGCEGA